MRIPGRVQYGLIGLGIAAVTAVFVSTAGAQGNKSAPAAPPPAGAKVVVVDVVKIFNDYLLQQDLSQELQQAQATLQGVAKTKQTDVEALQKQVELLDPSDPTYSGRMQELLRMQAEGKVWFESTQAIVTNELTIWSNNIYDAIVKEVGALARERGYDIVLYRDEHEPGGADPEQVKERIRRRKVVWNSENVDITATVLQRLNSKYASQPKTPKLKIPSRP